MFCQIDAKMIYFYHGGTTCREVKVTIDHEKIFALQIKYKKKAGDSIKQIKLQKLAI